MINISTNEYYILKGMKWEDQSEVSVTDIGFSDSKGK